MRTAVATAACRSGLTPGNVSFDDREARPLVDRHRQDADDRLRRPARRPSPPPPDSLRRDRTFLSVFGQLRRIEPAVDARGRPPSIAPSRRSALIDVLPAVADRCACRPACPALTVTRICFRSGVDTVDDRIDLAADASFRSRRWRSDARLDVLEQEPVEDRSHPRAADVLDELGLERMPDEHELGDRPGLDAVIERHRLPIVAHLAVPRTRTS